jgi:hypothetical protein
VIPLQTHGFSCGRDLTKAGRSRDGEYPLVHSRPFRTRLFAPTKSWSLTSTFDDAGVSVAHVSTRIAVWVALVERTPLPR